MVSDMYLCLFETETWSFSKLNLVFWSSLKSLVAIRKNVAGNTDTIKLVWKQQKKKDNYIIELEINEHSDLINFIMDKMKQMGINSKVSRKDNRPRSGVLPFTDIKSVEEAIEDMESKVGNKIEQVEVEYLMDLYSKVKYIRILK